MKFADPASVKGRLWERPALSFEPVSAFVSGTTWDVANMAQNVPSTLVNTIVSRHLLQHVVDYRSTIKDWFNQLLVGGHLIITVPHAYLHERRLALPSPWDSRQRRLYTPGVLAAEVEEALAPNSYRVRWNGDLDAGYDYTSDPDALPQGDSAAAIVLQRIVPPQWSPLVSNGVVIGGELPPRSEPAHAFEPVRSRVEVTTFPAIETILVLKLDHLGDFIMGLPALERLRGLFPAAHITLVVGQWNAVTAAETNIADRVIEFDAFPRNSSEEEPNVEATLRIFRSLITDEYDLAIDLRTDVDTRTLLRAAHAKLKAGIGTRARFPFLDIALPLDATRNEAERAREDRIGSFAFSAQGSALKRTFDIRSQADKVERDCAIVWGPYLELAPGDYIFDFFIELEDGQQGGMLKLDVALDAQVVSELFVSHPQNYHLRFHVDKPGRQFEARIWAVDDLPSLSFTFHGGVMIRRAARSVLHQSEYLLLLIELVAMRMTVSGMLTDVATLTDPQAT